MPLLITYIVSILSSILICKVLLKKHLIQSEQIFDKYLKQANEITEDYLKKVLTKVDKLR